MQLSFLDLNCNGACPVTITADLEDLNLADFMMMLAQSQKTGQLTMPPLPVSAKQSAQCSFAAV